MSIEIILLLLLIGTALTLLVLEVFPVDAVALTLMTVLLLTGYVTVDEAISGFSNRAVLTVAAMFVLSRALVKTGFLETLVDRFSRRAGERRRLTIGLFLLTISLVSGFINNTAAVAISIPLALQLCQRLKISPSKVLLPLSYAAIFGGTLTLIGTSTNLLVSAIIGEYDIRALGMFEFTRLGLIFMTVGTLYNIFILPRLLKPRAGISSLTHKYRLSPYLTEFKLAPKSPLIGRTILEEGISEKYDITILAIIRSGKRLVANLRSLPLKSGDILLARGILENFARFREQEKALMLTDIKMNQEELTGQETVIVEGLVPQGSALIGENLKSLDFRKKFGAFVLAINREGRVLRERIAQITLKFADTLLIFVPQAQVDKLNQSTDLLLLQTHTVQLHKVRFWWLAVAVIPVVMLSAASGRVDILTAALAGVVLLLLLRSLSVQELYGAIDWSVIIFIAAFIPVGIALQNTGGAALLGNLIARLGAFFPDRLAPYALLSITYLATSLLTEIMSNNSAAIVLTPIAIAIATGLGVDPRPFVFTICFAASASFMSPMGYNSNLMVFGPGNYRFSDYIRAGAPLNLIFWLLATFLIPVFWPFY
ncbi:MAG: SLC13 family permease [Candidatus Neomarinimicrobiota bacterium]